MKFLNQEASLIILTWAVGGTDDYKSYRMSLVYSDLKLSGGHNFRTVRFIKGQPPQSDNDDDDNTYLLILISFSPTAIKINNLNDTSIISNYFQNSIIENSVSSTIIVNKEFIKSAKLKGKCPKTERSVGRYANVPNLTVTSNKNILFL